MPRDFALSASFVLECFDGSEVTTREGNELVVHKEIKIAGAPNDNFRKISVRKTI